MIIFNKIKYQCFLLLVFFKYPQLNKKYSKYNKFYEVHRPFQNNQHFKNINYLKELYRLMLIIFNEISKF